jgi:hypothetical protein
MSNGRLEPEFDLLCPYGKVAFINGKCVYCMEKPNPYKPKPPEYYENLECYYML